MKFEALVRVDVVVPFDFDAPELDITDHLTTDGAGTTKIADVKAYEKLRSEQERARGKAGKHASTELAEKVKKALKSTGDVTDALVVEVREAAK